MSADVASTPISRESIAAEQLELAEAAVDLGGVVADCARLLRTAAAGSGVTAAIDLLDFLPRCWRTSFA